MDLAPQFLEFVRRRAIAYAASVSLFVAGQSTKRPATSWAARDAASRSLSAATNLPFSSAFSASQVRRAVQSVPGQQSEQPRPARPVRGNGRAGYVPAIIRRAQSAIGVLLIEFVQLLSQSYGGFEVGVRLRTVPRCDREPGDGV